MDTEITQTLEPGEEVVWRGTMSRGMLFFSLVCFLVPILLIGGFGFTQDQVGLQPCGRNQASCLSHPMIFEVNGVVFGSAILVIGFIAVFANYLWQLAEQYTVTSKRVIIKSGFRGKYRSLYYGQMKEVADKTGILARMVGLRTIRIDTGRVGALERNLVTGQPDPYRRRAPSDYDWLKNVKITDAAANYLTSAVENAKESTA